MARSHWRVSEQKGDTFGTHTFKVSQAATRMGKGQGQRQGPGGGHCREGHAVGVSGNGSAGASEMKRCLLDTWLLGCQI